MKLGPEAMVDLNLDKVEKQNANRWSQYVGKVCVRDVLEHLYQRLQKQNWQLQEYCKVDCPRRTQTKFVFILNWFLCYKSVFKDFSLMTADGSAFTR